MAALAPIVQRSSPSFCRPVRCLYIAPLKALTNDARANIRKNLLDLKRYLPANVALPRVAVRTGDAGATERKQLLSEPPDILLTTPESLAIMLCQDSFRALLGQVRHVIVDEIHSLLSNKRGADLTLSLERLEEFCGIPVQRIGLSAPANRCRRRPLLSAVNLSIAHAGDKCARSASRPLLEQRVLAVPGRSITAGTAQEPHHAYFHQRP